MGLFDRFKRGGSEADDEAGDEEDFDFEEAESEAAEDSGEDSAEDGGDFEDQNEDERGEEEGGDGDEDSEEDNQQEEEEDEEGGAYGGGEDSGDSEDGGDDDADADGGEDYEYDEDEDEDEDGARSGRAGWLAGLVPKGRRPRLILTAAGVFTAAGVLAGVTAGMFLGGDEDGPEGRKARPGTVSLALPDGGLTASGGGLNAIGVGAGSENAAFGGGAAATAAAGALNAAAGAPAGAEEPAFLNPDQDSIDAEGLNAFAVPGGQTQRSGTDIIADVTGPDAFKPVTDSNAGGALQFQPDQALLESVQGGLLVPKTEGRRSALTVYARPSSPPAGRPRAAIVVIGLGHSRTSAKAAIEKLPPEISLSFDVYAANLQSWVRESWKFGHEVLISLPMESANFPNEDAGPMALSTDFSVKANLRRLNSIMGRAKGYIGMQTAMGSAFMADEARIKPVLETVKQRGLMIFESTKDPSSLVPRLTTEMGVPRAFVNVEIDVNPSHAAVGQRLADLEAIARQRGAAVGVTRALPSALERIAEWAGEAEKRGIALVPVSRIANRGSGKT